MKYAATVLADSIASGVRLTTLEVTHPRFILAEVNTHRMLSRNSASSRAIPVERRIEQVRTSPFVPEAFAKNKRGMQADAVLDSAEEERARFEWLLSASRAATSAEILARLGVHKQHANRILEPYTWHTAVITATEWANFFALRCHPAAQPEMRITAEVMRDAMQASTPRSLGGGDWHLPYVSDDEMPWLGGGASHEAALRLSVVRCAAVSFERQNAERTPEQVQARHDEMVRMAHWSPFEHQAQVGDVTLKGWSEFVGNFRAPWIQYRKRFDGEAVFHGR